MDHAVAISEGGVAAASAITHELAAHIAQAQYSTLPAAAINAAKAFMLDTLAVAWAGSNAPGCGGAREVMLDAGGKPESTVWAYGDRLPVTATAFLNSMFGAALDFDSLGRDSPAHVNIVVLPAALAMAERQHASGRDFIAALSIGCDLMLRLGASCEALGKTQKGWFYTSVHGVFGAAAASAKLAGLDAPAIQHALGIAFSQAAGTQQANVEPSLAKRMQSAFAARAGVFSALLAEKGITAPAAVVEGDFGLYRMYQDGDRARLFDALGTRFENGNLSIKKFPSCGCNHTAIEGALRLTHTHDFKADDVDAIEVEISPFMDRLVGGVFDPAGDAQVAAQFNIRYSIACALMRRQFGLAELDPLVVRDAAIGRLVQKGKVSVDPNNTGKRGPMVLRIRTCAGAELQTRIEHVPGSAETPMSDEEITLKARQCFALGVRPLSPAQCRTILDRVLQLEDVADMATLFHGV